MSAQATRSTPPPTQAPWMAASTGLRQRSRLVSVSCRSRIRLRRFSRVRASQASFTMGRMPIIICRSMPAQKCSPAPCSTATRTAGVRSTHCIAARRSCHICRFIALALSGRFSVTSATWPSRPMRRVSNCGRGMPAPPGEAGSWPASSAGADAAFSMLAANSMPCLIARLASSSAATSAPPIRCTRMPASTSAACSSRCGSWPVHRITLSTASTSSLPPMLTCRPASSMRR